MINLSFIGRRKVHRVMHTIQLTFLRMLLNYDQHIVFIDNLREAGAVIAISLIFHSFIIYREHRLLMF